MEIDWVFLDVGFDRKEILVDEGRDFIVGIGFGLQPNTGASSRSSAEVEQQGLLVSLCLSECRINVFVPLNCHFQSLLEIKSNMAIALLYQPRSGLTTAFSCCARSAFKLKERSYLRNKLSRRQLQRLCWLVPAGISATTLYFFWIFSPDTKTLTVFSR
jgi:hypothetical protein